MTGEDAERGMNKEQHDLSDSSLISEECFYYYEAIVGQIELALPQCVSRVLLLSSSVAREGTTDVAVGLGLTLAAHMSRKTAVIDCNVHRPEIHVRFGAKDIGLTEYISGEATLEQVLVNTTVPNLHIMSLGRKTESLAAFDKGKLQNLLSDLRNRFDYVLVDAAPVGLYPEVTVLCTMVDGVILVVRHGSTRREVVKRTKDTVERAGGRALGVILNRRKFPIPEFLYRRL